MNSFLREILGGIVLMIAASIAGIVVNVARPDGLPLIQAGAPVETAPHGSDATPDSAAADSTGAVALPEGAVSLEEMKRLIDSGTAVVIDARSSTEYEEGHLPGAINIPHDRLPEFIDALNSEVPLDAQVVLYCRGPECDFSDMLATEMKIMGYQNVAVFTGGWEHWTGAGYPTEAGPR